MEVHGIVVEVIERPYWFAVEILVEDDMGWFTREIRCVPKRFDVNFGDYLSMDPVKGGNAIWARATSDCDINGPMGQLIPFLEVDSMGQIFENGKFFGRIKKIRKKGNTDER